VGGADGIEHMREISILAEQEILGSGDHQDVAVAGRDRPPRGETLRPGAGPAKAPATMIHLTVNPTR